jgi:uncharacterized protein (TIGR02246 family)
MDRPVDTSAADDRAIRALVARYCHAIAERDDAAWADTWGKDAEWNVLGRNVRGRDAIVALYLQLIASARWVVQVATDGIVEVDGERASGRWLIQETIQFKDGRALVNVGRYLDRYQRDADGAWRFARRELHAIYLGPPDLSAEPRPMGGWAKER